MILNEEKFAEELIKQGFQGDNVGKYCSQSRILGKYYKMLGYPAIDTKKLLKEHYQKHTGLTDITVLDDKINKIVDTIYIKNIKLYNRGSISVLLEDMQLINNLKTDGERRVLFYAIMCARFYEKNVIHIGTVYCGRSMGLTKTWVRSMLAKLETNGFIKEKSFRGISCSAAKRFTLTNFSLETADKGVVHTIDILDSQPKILLDDYFKAYRKSIKDYGFKVTRDFKRHILEKSA